MQQKQKERLIIKSGKTKDVKRQRQKEIKRGIKKKRCKEYVQTSRKYNRIKREVIYIYT